VLMAQKQIKKGQSEELDLQDLLEEDIKVGDIIGIAYDEGTDTKSVIKWDFYFVMGIKGEEITLSKTLGGASTITLSSIAKSHEECFYLYVPMEEGREQWTPGNRNLNEIPIETVIMEVFQLSHKEHGWTTRSVESIAEETGLQSGRIRRALRGDNRFEETDKGNWKCTVLSSKGKPNSTPASTTKEKTGRRRGSR
jgi:hypothetical protein